MSGSFGGRKRQPAESASRTLFIPVGEQQAVFVDLRRGNVEICSPDTCSVDWCLKSRVPLGSSGEVKDLRTKLDMWERESDPHVVVVVGYSCNLCCGYCYLGDLRGSTERIVGPLLEHAICALRGIAQGRPGRLTITGGEPLLDAHYDSTIALVEVGSAMGMDVDIITNGTELAEHADDLGRFGVSVQVTIDGPADVHDSRRPARGYSSFAKIMRGIERALASGIRVIVRTNLDGSNVAALPSLYRILEGRWRVRLQERDARRWHYCSSMRTD